MSTLSSRAAPLHGAAAQPDEPVKDGRALALLFLRNLAAEVSGGTVNLPSFPDVVLRVRKSLADPNASLNQTAKLISTEPRLAALLLQSANSAAFNPGGHGVTDLRAAITRLGHRAVQGSAMAFAVRQIRLAPALRSIAKPLNVLWEQSITVASVCQVLARRTAVSPDEAFLTGLMHGIGRLYIMVRAVGKANSVFADPAFLEVLEGWHPAIGKAVLKNWGFSDAMCEALGDQMDYDRESRTEADLTDILIVGVALALVMREPGPRTVTMDGICSFQRLALTSQECASVMQIADHQLGSLHAALGC
jgi:HD-like signal output (HDOD) protein